MRTPPTLLLLAVGVALVVGPAAVPAAGSPGATDPVGEWPLRPVPQVVAGFDPPSDPWGAGHRGVDLLSTAGRVVHAALPGRVGFAGRIAGRGVVVVEHGPTRTTYEPVTASVDVGDQVAAGQALGQLGLVGSHCFPRACLHWGWIRGETYLDPLDLVGAGPVRLLPLWRSVPVPAGPRPALRPAYPGWQPLLRWHGTGPFVVRRVVSTLRARPGRSHRGVRHPAPLPRPRAP